MKRERKPKWSFVVLRGADKTVKQFHVSKRSVFAAPTAALLAVTGCFGGLHLKSTYELHQLEEQLTRQDAQFTQTVAAKNEAILSLQEEIIELIEQAADVEQRVNDLQQLEQKLQQFIESYGSRIAPSAYQIEGQKKEPSLPALPNIAPIPSFLTAAKIDSKQYAQMAQKTNLSLASLQRMIRTMEESMTVTLELAKATRSSVDGYPSFWPTRSRMLTSGFGYRSDPFTGRSTFHAGIDITGKLNDPVFSAADGLVAETGYNRSHGNYIIIDHPNDLQSAYMHLSQIEAIEGDTVVRGEKLGLLGSSGRSTGPHLHFQIMQKNEPTQPLKFLALIKED
ncbi:M23 family metallopeptidase [Paenibacillus sp. FSL H8-0548]|uniref:M23 family metallopeptidase n=1 Tax=Paenibacillus sp. FSL H8-0548 TaxID=1920422 RepID=UPI0015C3171F|nr:M23 family metallopeptidase [Paenibacillus sp. FSL H8-0548]